ncbi:hypothetical protein BLNAU_19267 [Blattamonas nauphoetae]|uniref:Uncharacterized protein n=1 Tax=Blattamonas nauphoetae TaxID=2049346 RepID=A0ABQ9X1X7_9EUKA|nr:hypothetical protein BLNAU_19267 [Blattamonas nauphoetae]
MCFSNDTYTSCPATPSSFPIPPLSNESEALLAQEHVERESILTHNLESEHTRLYRRNPKWSEVECRYRRETQRCNQKNNDFLFSPRMSRLVCFRGKGE